MKIKRMRYKRKKIFFALFLFLLIVGIGVGYALITTKLSIEGVAKVKEARWDIHFDNFEAMSGSVTPTTEPVVNNDTITFSAKVDEPGNFYGFTFDVVNDGTINAELADFSVTPDFSTINYIDSTIEYENGAQIAIGDLLPANKSKKIKVLLSYKDGIDESLYPTTDQSFNVTLTIRYQQYTNKLTTFADDTWDAIKTNVEKDPTAYPVGSTKSIKMDLDGDGIDENYMLRVANNTTPSECSEEGFSQTACGFVVEFQDIITSHRMNSYTDGTADGDGNKGGWEYSDMRAYLNSTTYAYENIDYSTSGIFNSLPSDLRSKVIDTIVISGYGSNDSENFKTTDKLYLLDGKEIYGDSFNSSNNTAKDNERQLDYYSNNGVSASNYSGAIRKNLSGAASWWWFRSSESNNVTNFSTVTTPGYWGATRSNYNCGVSPAFRIAE